MPNKNRKKIKLQASNLDRHQARCTICTHPQREDIEAEFVAWTSPAKIAKVFKLGDRSCVYRHAHATGLFAKRDRNVRAALGRIIERVDDVPATSCAIIQAIALLLKINARGELVERGELAGLHELFGKMTPDEMEAYAHSGTLPAWFPRSTAAKDPQGTGGTEND